MIDFTDQLFKLAKFEVDVVAGDQVEFGINTAGLLTLVGGVTAITVRQG